MIVECATVTGLGDGMVRVVCERQAGCQRCAEGRGCGGGLLGLWLRGRLRVVEAAATLPGIAVGDRVQLGLPESALLRGAALAYGLPLLGLVLGAGISGVGFGAGDAWSAAGTALGLAAGLLLARRLSARWLDSLRPQLLARLPAPASSR